MRFVKNWSSLVIISICVGSILLSGSDANAQFGAIELSQDGRFEVGMDDSDATYSISHSSASLSLGFLGVDYSFERYFWEKPEILPFSASKNAPWENLHRLSLFTGIEGALTEKWSAAAMATGEGAFEQESDDAYVNGMGGAILYYAWSDAWDIAVGGGAVYDNRYTEQEGSSDGWAFIPGGGFRWNYDAERGWFASMVFPVEMGFGYRADAWNFETELAGFDGLLMTYSTLDESFRTSVGASLENGLTTASVQYAVTPLLSLNVGYAYEMPHSSVYRISPDNLRLSSGVKETYLETEGKTVEMSVGLKFSERIRLAFGPYYTFDRKMSLYREDDGDDHEKEERLYQIGEDDAFGGKCSLRMMF